MAKFNLPFGLNIAAAEPTDTRQVVVNQTEREQLIGLGISYEGMLVYQADNSMLYVLEGTTNNDWETVGSSSGGSVISVNGQTGNVVLGTDDIAEGTTNLYNRVPTGGTAGQVLSKIDGSNYNTEWTDVSGGVIAGIGITDNAGVFDLGTFGTPITEDILIEGENGDSSTNFKLSTTGSYLDFTKSGLFANKGTIGIDSEGFPAINSELEFSGNTTTSFFGVNSEILGLKKVDGLSTPGSDKTVMFGITGDNKLLIESDISDFVGIEYDIDYSANYTDRSLVDKEYVDQTSTYTPGYGIKIDGNNEISLGSDIGGDNEHTLTLLSGLDSATNPTYSYINMNTFGGSFGGVSNNATTNYRSVFRTNPGSGLTVSTEVQETNSYPRHSSSFSVFSVENGDVNNITISANNEASGKTNTELQISNSTTESIIVLKGEDTVFKGAEYDKDYSANYTDRSLVDKGYVDGLEHNNLINIQGGAPGDYYHLTLAERDKLAGLEDSKFLGLYPSLAALETAHPSPDDGSYAFVDEGVSSDVVSYIWDPTDDKYVLQLGESTAETPATIKLKYESNPDTNAFTDSDKDFIDNFDESSYLNTSSISQSKQGWLAVGKTAAPTEALDVEGNTKVSGDVTVGTSSTTDTWSQIKNGYAQTTIALLRHRDTTSSYTNTSGLYFNAQLNATKDGITKGSMWDNAGAIEWKSFTGSSNGHKAIVFKMDNTSGSDATTPVFTDVMSITREGKVGIGSHIPTEALDVVGNAKVSGQIEGSTLLLTPQAQPASPTEGTTYYDSTTKVVYVWDGTAWQNVY